MLGIKLVLNPCDGDTITINGTTYTFVSKYLGKKKNEITISLNLLETLQNLAKEVSEFKPHIVKCLYYRKKWFFFKEEDYFYVLMFGKEEDTKLFINLTEANAEILT